jgi:hypothetical protein
MANTKSAVATLIDAGKLPDLRKIGARLKVFVFDVILATQGATDTIDLGDLPAGFVFLFGFLNGDTTLATAQPQVGTTATVGKYRAAAVYTAINAPSFFGVYVAPLAAKERVIITNTVAALPAAGNLQVVIVGTVGD